MEKTFQSEAGRIHEGFQEASKLIEMKLSVRWDPTRRVKTRVLVFLCNVMMRLAGSSFRVKFRKHEGG